MTQLESHAPAFPPTPVIQEETIWQVAK